MKKTLLITPLLLIAIAGSASAQILQLDNRSAFGSAITGETTVGFSSLSGTAVVSSVTVGDVTFTGDLAKVHNGDFGDHDGSAEYLINYTGGDGGGIGGTATLTLDTPGLTAVGFDTFSIAANPTFPSTLAFTGIATDNLGNTLTYSSTALAGTGSPSQSFVGFVDTAPGAYLTSITWSNASNAVGIDNVSTGFAIPIEAPEPSTWALFILGGALLLFKTVRRQSVN